MCVIHPVAAVRLDAGADTAAKSFRSLAVESQVAVDIRQVMQAGVARKQGDLVVDLVVERALQGGHRVTVHFTLLIVQRSGVVCGRQASQRTIDADVGWLPWIVRNLEFSVIAAQHETQFGVGIQQIGQVRETFSLMSGVMYRIDAGGWILDPVIAGQVRTIDEIGKFPFGVSIFDAGLKVRLLPPYRSMLPPPSKLVLVLIST